MADALSYRLEAADGAALDVRGGRIATVQTVAAPTFRLGEGTLMPGLINAHDHLHRNHFPRLGSPPYPDAYAWGLDLHGRFAEEIARLRGLDRRTALLFGALKNLLGGATTVVHHDPPEPAFDDDFPVRIARIPSVHSLRFETDPTAFERLRSVDGPRCIHLAEGTNAEAAEEIREVERRGLLDASLLAVHVVGADADGVRRFRASGAAVVWCPSSNAFLFGRTAPAELLAPGVDVLLGTDSLLSGEGTLLAELRSARRLGLLDDGRLASAVGTTAAARLGLPDPTLAPGAAADLLLLRRPLLDAEASDVELVTVAGVPRLADERFSDLFEMARIPPAAIRVGGRARLVSQPLAEALERVLELSPECGRILS